MISRFRELIILHLLREQVLSSRKINNLLIVIGVYKLKY